VRVSEGLIEALDTARVLVEKVAEVRGGRVRGAQGEEHTSKLRRPLSLTRLPRCWRSFEESPGAEVLINAPGPSRQWTHGYSSPAINTLLCVDCCG